MAFLSLVLVVVIWKLFVCTRTGQAIDTIAMMYAGSYMSLMRGFDRLILMTVSIPTVIIFMILAGVIAIVRHRWALAGRALGIIVISTLLTQFLKSMVFYRPDKGILYHTVNSLPSGHVTAAATAAVALTIVVPPRWRSLTACAGAIFTIMMGISVIGNRWHRPSDVLSAIIVVLAVTLLLTPFESRLRIPRARGALHQDEGAENAQRATRNGGAATSPAFVSSSPASSVASTPSFVSAASVTSSAASASLRPRIGVLWLRVLAILAAIPAFIGTGMSWWMVTASPYYINSDDRLTAIQTLAAPSSIVGGVTMAAATAAIAAFSFGVMGVVDGLRR